MCLTPLSETIKIRSFAKSQSAVINAGKRLKTLVKRKSELREENVKGNIVNEQNRIEGNNGDEITEMNRAIRRAGAGDDHNGLGIGNGDNGRVSGDGDHGTEIRVLWPKICNGLSGTRSGVMRKRDEIFSRFHIQHYKGTGFMSTILYL
uniref:Uncharacterized protein n=1 Tax=Spongospora subterranea TaxID=70186 RepID=A0A0H5QYE8_9EUKA|eukprot:CRZ06955.1 hypothetical protein [Spongospora subterranea]